MPAPMTDCDGAAARRRTGARAAMTRVSALAIIMAGAAGAARADDAAPAPAMPAPVMIAQAQTGAPAAAAPAKPAPKAEAQKSSELETVTVTARRREESIQTTPVSVTAVSGGALSRLFVRDLTDLNHQAPNFTIEGVGAIHRNAAVIYSRGIGYSGVDQGQDPAVGVSVNGVFFSRNIGALSNMLDVDHVEMLRGPQGTLFGKNTIGGVVNITTKKPGDTFDVLGSIRYGNNGRNDYFLASDLPITDTLSARVSYQGQNSDGSWRNAYKPTDGSSAPARLGNDNIKTIRGTLAWNPTDTWSFDLVGTYTKDRSGSVGGQNGSGPNDLLYKLGYKGFGYPGGPTDPFTIYRNYPSGDFQDTFNVTLNGRYHAKGFDVISVTGYQRDANFTYNDYDDSAAKFYETTFQLHHKQFTQELRAESTDQSKLKWVGGLYGSTVKWDADQVYYLPILSPAAPILEDFAAQDSTSLAAFAQADYALTDKLTIEFGLRVTNDEKKFSRTLQHPITIPTPAPFLSKKTWTNTNYHANLSYQVTPDLLAYFNYSTGYIAGGFNTRANLAGAIGPFAPETADAYEAGVKGDWLNHKLRTNVAVFWNEYNDLQVGVFQAVGGATAAQQVVANAANERARGVELEASVIPVENLLISTSLGYLDAKYTSFFSDLSGTGKKTDNTYLRPYRAPELTARVEGSYNWDLGGRGSLTPSLAYAYEGSHVTDLLNSVQGYQGAYWTLDSSLTYEEPKGRWKIAAWGKNLTNKVHKLSAVPTAGLLTQLYFAEPRLYGIDFTVKFGQ